MTPAIPPDDIGNRIEAEASEDAPEPNFNTYPPEVLGRSGPQPSSGGGSRRRRGGRGGRGPREQLQSPAVPPTPREDIPPVTREGGGEGQRPSGGSAGEGGGGGSRRRRKKRGGRGRGPRGPEQILSREAGSGGALSPEYPEDRFSTGQPVSEVSPDLPVVAQPPSSEAPQATPPSAPAHAPRKPRGVVVLAIGLPGSGKSSWFKRRGVQPLSSDLLRTLLFDNITEQRYQDLVFSTLRSLLRARMIARMPWNYVDATNLSPRERRGWIRMSQEFGYEVHAVFFDVPVEVCLERNKRRDRIVPEEAMQRMAAKLRPPTFEEGFSKIIVVRVKRREGEPTAEIQASPDVEGAAEDEEVGGEDL